MSEKFGVGEASAIALALDTSNPIIIIDDQRAKSFAFDLGLDVIGTIGVIKRAVDLNIINRKGGI